MTTLANIPSRARKYRNAPVVVDGVRFASKLEARRWQELLLLQRAGQIHDLRRQVRHKLTVGGHEVCVYVADFDYLDATGSPVTEDAKGFPTPEFRLKARLFRALMGRDVVLVGKGRAA